MELSYWFVCLRSGRGWGQTKVGVDGGLAIALAQAAADVLAS